MDHEHHSAAGSKLDAYRPLVVIIGVCAAAGVALQGAGLSFMHGFMGLFFLLFGMFKFFDLDGFAGQFRQYDLVAARAPAYALAYPVIELLLGLAYLGYWQPRLTYILTVLLMGVSAAGVIRGIATGRAMTCACLGTLLKVPLSTVSVIENLGMGLMAAWALA